MNKPLFFVLTSCLLFLSFLLSATMAWGDELRSNSFVIQFGNFNMTSGEKSSASYNLTDTVGQAANGPYGQYGSSAYFVGGGFQYIYQIDDFRFSISRTAIDLGILTPGVFATASHNLEITTRGAGGYTVYAYELHPLRHSGGSYTIPDTTCNAGTCTESTAQVWTSTSATGFGFNMTGNDIPADFTDSTYFRQFANQAGAESMQSVMLANTVSNNRTSTVTYKAAISGSQAAGSYQTGIVYIAVPRY